MASFQRTYENCRSDLSTSERSGAADHDMCRQTSSGSDELLRRSLTKHGVMGFEQCHVKLVIVHRPLRAGVYAL